MMTERQHLSDLQLDRMRLGKGQAGPDQSITAHLSRCLRCQKRLQEMESIAQCIRPQLAAALLQAERTVPAAKTAAWRLWLPVAIGASAIGLLVAVILWQPFAHDQKDNADTVVLKGGQTLQLRDSKTNQFLSEQLQIGQNIRIDLSGVPPPRALFQKDAAGQVDLLWPHMGEASLEPGQRIELDAAVGEPAGALAFFAVFGPVSLTKDQVEGIQQMLRQGAALEDVLGLLPDGFHLQSRGFRIRPKDSF